MEHRFGATFQKYTKSIQKQCQRGTKIVTFQEKGIVSQKKRLETVPSCKVSGNILVPLGHCFNLFC